MSSPNNPPEHKVVIPEALRVQLDGFRRHLWRVKILEAITAGLIGLLVSFLLVYGLDRVFQTPGWVRLAILIGGASLFGVFAPYWLHRWVWRQRREDQLARLIARRFPGLGDRLLGVIELQDQEANADSLSPRLREAAMQAVAVETGKRKLDGALPPQRHRRWALAAFALALLSGAAFMLTPRAGWNAFERWLMPLSNTERYTFTKLQDPPIYQAVAFGEAFEVTLRLSKDSEQRPSQATGQYGLQPMVTCELGEDTYKFTFPGQQDPGTISFRVGDLRHEMRIEPVPRPSVESSIAVVTSPDYLGVPERTVDLNAGVVSAVEGSKVRIELTTNRPLASASFGPTRAQAIDDKTDHEAHVPFDGTLTITGFNAKTPVIEVRTVPFEIPFAWTDELGLAGESGFRLRVDAMQDAAPTCYLQGIERQKVMLPEETIDFEVLAEDDFGVKQMGIEWSGQFTRPTDEAPAKGENKLSDGGPEERRVMTPAAFSPLALGITPQKITLRGYTEDYFPNRRRIYSEPVTVYVLTRDEHAQLLKNKFDRQITEFEDLARREQELLDENEKLNRLGGEKLQSDENPKKLESQEEAEAESKRRMEDLTKRMEELMKDAARNGDIEKDTLKKMAESLKSMQELSAEDLPKVEGKLDDSQDKSNTAEKTQKDVEEAVEEQKKAVEKMQDAIAKANEANRKFEAGTFVNRLKKAATEENGIATSLVEAYERILGVKSSKLLPSEERRMADVIGQQSNTASDVRWIQEDLASYFARTSTESFREILNEMRESNIDVGLAEVRNLLTSNHSFKATESSKKWADMLDAWAKKLEGEKDDDANGGGDGDGGGKSPEDEDFEFMLRVMKMVQQEQDLRSQTRVLEQLRRGNLKQPGKNAP
jgi:CRP-like cAMP-binding protein